MGKILNISVFILFALAKADALETDFVEDIDERTREFILEQNLQMKADIQKLFDSFSQAIEEKISTYRNDMEKSHEKLSESLNQKATNIDSKLEKSLQNNLQSIIQRIASSDLKVEKSQKDILDFIKLSETNIISKLESQSDVIRKNQELLQVFGPPASTSTTNSSHGERRVEVQRMGFGSGKIEFKGEANSDLRHKIWVFPSAADSRLSAGFVMEVNNLGQKAYLNLWSTSGDYHVWNGTQTKWREEISSTAFLIVLTLTTEPSLISGSPPSFKLSFNASRRRSTWVHSSEVITNNGLQSLSFPPLNARRYAPLSMFTAVMAPSSGRPFSLTLKYLDVPGSSTDCVQTFKVFFLEEGPNGVNYKEQNQSPYRRCGKDGEISDLIGTPTVAILWFYSHSAAEVGRGFRLEMKPNQ